MATAAAAAARSIPPGRVASQLQKEHNSLMAERREDVIRNQQQQQLLYSYRPRSGHRFDPNEQELVAYYLFNKVAGVKNLRHDPSAIIPTVELYGPSTEPWRVCGEVAFPYRLTTTEFFCFATRKQRHGDYCNRVAGIGTWTATGKDKKIWHRGVLVGRRAFLSFKVPPPGATGPVKKNEMVTTHWNMYEYRLESPNFQTTVLCKIRNQKKEDALVSGQWKAPWWEECSSSKKRNEPSSCSDQVDIEDNRGFGTERAASESSKKQKMLMPGGGTAAAAGHEQGSNDDDFMGSTGKRTPTMGLSTSVAEHLTLEHSTFIDCPLPVADLGAAALFHQDPLSSETLPGNVMFTFQEPMLGDYHHDSSISSAPPAAPVDLDAPALLPQDFYSETSSGVDMFTFEELRGDVAVDDSGISSVPPAAPVDFDVAALLLQDLCSETSSGVDMFTFEELRGGVDVDDSGIFPSAPLCHQEENAMPSGNTRTAAIRPGESSPEDPRSPAADDTCTGATPSADNSSEHRVPSPTEAGSPCAHTAGVHSSLPDHLPHPQEEAPHCSLLAVAEEPIVVADKSAELLRMLRSFMEEEDSLPMDASVQDGLAALELGLLEAIQC